MMASTHMQRRGAPVLTALLALALAASVCGQPAGDDGYGYGPTPATPAMPVVDTKPPGRSKLCPNTIWDKSGKCSASAFESCARKLVKAVSDVYVLINDTTAGVALVKSFALPSGVSRFTPVATFSNALLPEYLSFFVHGTNGALMRALSYKVRRFVAACPVIAATVDVQVQNAITNVIATATFEIWFRLDKTTNRVSVYDAELVRLEEHLTALGVPALIKAMPDVVFGQMSSTVCKQHTQFCVGALQQYAGEEECTTYLKALPIMDYKTFSGNTTYCRFFHTTFLEAEPYIHCNHIGKNSAICRDITYDSYYQDSRLNAPAFVMGGKF